jgi:A/G-specific adenine glycosylase
MAVRSKAHHSARRRSKQPAAALLTWYDAHRRVLPWRAQPGKRADPYCVWLSEIMLQQTTVAAVAPYYHAFLKRWPDMRAIAKASLDDVLSAWAGLGYYSRARNLHRAAQIIVNDYGGVFPRTSVELSKLPGIGAYTSNAIAAIAFNEPVAALDANGERVIARLFAVKTPLPKSRPQLRELAQQIVPHDRPGDFAQALMDLGSAICMPKKPACAHCTLSVDCQGFALGIAEKLPRKVAKSARPLKRGAAFVAVDRYGAVYLEKRAEKGLLGAMLQPPLGAWTGSFPAPATARKQAPFTGKWTKRAGIVRHGFTHFELEMEVYAACFNCRPNGKGRWYTRGELQCAALPTVMRKVISHALNGAHISSARTR